MKAIKKHATATVMALLIISQAITGLPVDLIIEAWNESKIVDNLYSSASRRDAPNLPRITKKVKAANFNMNTGYYMGKGSTQSITGLGFQPDFVFIKAETAAGAAAFKTSSMPSANMAFVTNAADDTGSNLVLNSDGFTLGTSASVNSANVRYVWMAFAGSDCTSSGTFCIGQYTGNASSPRTITTGFQPSFVVVKRTTSIGAHFHTASQPANESLYLYNAVRDTTGNYLRSFSSSGFSVGHSGTTGDNVSGGTYNYIAFKTTSGIMAEGTYSGNATDNRNITGLGFQPDAMLVKNATNATASNTRPILNTDCIYGDYSAVLTATASAVNYVQALQSDGFQVGTSVFTNGSGDTYYWVAFGGSPAPPAGSGTFEMATGSYSGNGSSVSISSLAFAPDLVIVKDNSTNYGVFRTSLMAADNTAYLALSTGGGNFTGGITSLTSNGFNIGASTVVNTNGNTYHWQAFGNAYKPQSRTGAADFTVGTYMGNGLDSRSITGQAFQPSLVTAKRNGTSEGTWRSSATSGDLSSFFTATAEGANRIQALQTDGFQVGTNASANSSGSLYNWFAFMEGSNFDVGTYTGSGGSQTINVGFQPELAWVKRSTNAAGTVHRGSSLSGDATQYFLNTANFTSGITSLVSNGFTLAGTTAATNASGGTYRYAAWKAPTAGILSADIVDSGGTPVANPGLSFGNVNSSLSCQASTGTLGSSSQKLRVSNETANGNWTLTIAATGGSTANWSNGSTTYDFNDANGTPNGCSDGADADSLAGRLTIDASAGTLTPEGGCSSSGVTKGSSSSFTQGSVDSVTLLTASSSQTGCYFDLIDASLSQQIPAETPANASAYTINMTLTITAN